MLELLAWICVYITLYIPTVLSYKHCKRASKSFFQIASAAEPKWLLATLQQCMAKKDKYMPPSCCIALTALDLFTSASAMVTNCSLLAVVGLHARTHYFQYVTNTQKKCRYCRSVSVCLKSLNPYNLLNLWLVQSLVACGCHHVF